MATKNEEILNDLVQQSAAITAAQEAALKANKPENKPLNQPTTSAATPSVRAADGTIITETATNTANATRGQSETTGQSIHNQFGNNTTTTKVKDLSPEQQAELDQRIAAVNQGNNIRLNPETGQYEYIDPNQTTLGTVLPGLRKNAEEAERINYSRSLGSALYNSLQALADMGIAIGGGNVYKRELDKTGIEAAKDTQARKDKLAEQEAAAKQRDADLLRAAADNAEKLRERFDAMRERVSSTNSNSAGVTTDNRTTNTESRSSNVSRSANEHYVGDSDGSSNNNDGDGSGSGGYKMVVDNTKGYQKHHVFNLSIKESNALKGLLLARYQDVLNNLSDDKERNKFIKSLSDAKIITITGKGAKEKITWDTDEILHNGKYWHLRPADRQMINEITKGKVRFTDTGDVLGEKDTFGTVPQGEQKIDADFDITKEG